MTTRPSPETIRRSRLDPEPMPRRDFLGRFAILSSLGAVLFALVGILRLPKAAVLPSPSKRFTVKLPESLAPGIPYMPPGRSVAIFKDPDGIYAVSIICTHLGCVVKVEGDGFKCPCHGSQFRRDGEVVQGPAPKALPWLAVSLSVDGTCIVDEGTVITHGRKVQA